MKTIPSVTFMLVVALNQTRYSLFANAKNQKKRFILDLNENKLLNHFDLELLITLF